MTDRCRVYIGQLDYKATERDLREHFGKYGEILNVDLICDKETQRPRGFAFVEYEHEEDANDAIDALNGKEILGRSIVVAHAKSRQSGGGRPSGSGYRDSYNSRNGGGGGRFRDGYGGGGHDNYSGGRDNYGGTRGIYAGGQDNYGGRRGSYGGGRDNYGGGRDGNRGNRY